MRKVFKSMAAAAAALLLTSCSSGGFYALSSARENGGIYRFDINGNIQDQLLLPTAGYLVRDPAGDLFYVTVNSITGTRRSNGGVAVIKSDNSGKLVLLQKAAAAIKTPCHAVLAPDGRFFYTANYSSGDIAEFAVQENWLETPPRLIKHSGSSVHKRQKKAHPHYVGFDPAGEKLFVCDLGTDHIWVYKYQPGAGVQSDCVEKYPLPPGSGPRHLAFAPDGRTFFVANELNSTVSSFVRSDSGTWILQESVSTLPPGKEHIRNYPGAIKISPDGRTLLVTNRGDDSIAWFDVLDNGKLKLVKNIDSQGKYPTDIIFSADGKQLFSVNLKDNNIALFEFDLVNKTLEFTGKTFALQRPAALLP